MKNETYVQFLTDLNVRYDNNIDKEIVLIEAKGFSENVVEGLPKLTLASDPNENLKDGILEFDLKIQPTESTKRERLDCDVKLVIEVSKLPKGLSGFKVNALNNADIYLWTPN